MTKPKAVVTGCRMRCCNLKRCYLRKSVAVDACGGGACVLGGVLGGVQLVAGVVELVEVCWQAKSATYMQFNAVLDIGAALTTTLLL